MLPLKAWAINKFSHRVPDPFLKTSSGKVGIIVQRAKIKSWIIFWYKKKVATESDTEYSANSWGLLYAYGSISSGSSSTGS